MPWCYRSARLCCPAQIYGASESGSDLAAIIWFWREMYFKWITLNLEPNWALGRSTDPDEWNRAINLNAVLFFFVALGLHSCVLLNPLVHSSTVARLQDDLNVFTCWLAWMISTADEKAKLKVHISPFLLLPSICAQFEFKITLLWYNFSKPAYLVEILRSYQICMLLINMKQSWYRSPLRHPSYYHWHDVFQVRSYSYTCSSISACGDISPLICL